MKISRATLVGVALAIFAGTVWLYWPCVRGGFLTGMDDDEYLQQAIHWNGLTWNGAKWAFTTTQPYYHPLPRLTHLLDYQVWGENAAGHHATNIILHGLNVALVFGFLWTLLDVATLTTGERFAVALGVSLVFALHPFQAESVAWMSGRTQLLCTTLGIGCVWAYIGTPRRWVAWGLFAAALLCKPMAMSLPFVMLAIDYFPLRRHEQLGWGPLIREKVVPFALAIVVGLATTVTESRVGGLMVMLEKITPWQHVLLVLESLAFYPWKLVWPSGLSPYYPLHSGISLGQPLTFVSALAVGVVTVLVLRQRQRAPAMTSGWMAYIILVLPVSGLMQTGSWTVANRYAYAAMLPLLLLAGGAMVWAWRRSTTAAHLGLVGLLVGELCVFGLLTHRQMLAWHDDETLWRTVLARFPDSELANQFLARALLVQGRASEALTYAQRSVEIQPELREPHVNLGFALAALGRLPDAVTSYEEALRIDPDFAEAHYQLGNTLAHLGRSRDAVAQYQEVLRINPGRAEAHFNLGIVLATLGESEEAIQQYQEALRNQPNYMAAHNSLANALVRAGKFDAAIQQYQQALLIKPDSPEIHCNLAITLERVGRTQEAIDQYKETLKLRSDMVTAKNALARLSGGTEPPASK